ncbi:MAG: hypothetical protein M1812_000554 [Candelaria pacifica]|nr:MAG: hypothetical protein M1812_000554 [Candelaria pacifica]
MSRELATGLSEDNATGETPSPSNGLTLSGVRTVFKSHPSFSDDVAIFELEDTSAPKRRQNRSTSHFLKLPPEIRIQIYGYLLTRKGPLNMVHWTKGDLDPNFAAIIQVNHEIANEAAEVLYRNSSFRFKINPPPRTRPFLDIQVQCLAVDIPSRFIPLLRDVVIFKRNGYYASCPTRGVHEVAAIVRYLAASAPQLEHLTIFVDTSNQIPLHHYQSMLAWSFFDTKSPIIEEVKEIPGLRRFTVQFSPVPELDADRFYTTEPLIVRDLSNDIVATTLNNTRVQGLRGGTEASLRFHFDLTNRESGPA